VVAPVVPHGTAVPLVLYVNDVATVQRSVMLAAYGKPNPLGGAA
jgi:hypothetical protein